jgi:hypothetical protein
VIGERADDMRAHGRALFERWLDHVDAPHDRAVAATR